MKVLVATAGLNKMSWEKMKEQAEYFESWCQKPDYSDRGFFFLFSTGQHS